MLSRLAARLALAFNLLFLLLNLSIPFGYIIHGMPKRDFAAFVTAGSIIERGRGSQLYDLNTQRTYQDALALEGDSFLPYLNPPHVSPLFVILALAPYNVTSRLWALVQVVLLALLCRAIWSHTQDWNSTARVLAVTTVAGSAAVGFAFYQGSLSLVITLALFGWYRNLERGKHTAAGAWLAVATLKPQVALLPIAATFRYYRALLAFTVVCLTLLVISILVLGWQSWIEYLEMIRSVEKGGLTFFLSEQNMTNLKSILVLTGVRHEIALTITSIALAGAFLSVAFFARHVARNRVRLAFTVLLGLFLAPHIHDTIALAFPAALIYDGNRFKSRENGRIRSSVFAWFALGVPLLINLGYLTYNVTLYLRLPQIFIVGLLAFSTFYLLKDKRTTT